MCCSPQGCVCPGGLLDGAELHGVLLDSAYMFGIVADPCIDLHSICYLQGALTKEQNGHAHPVQAMASIPPTYLFSGDRHGNIKVGGNRARSASKKILLGQVTD